MEIRELWKFNPGFGPWIQPIFSGKARKNARRYICWPALGFQAIGLKFSGEPLHSLGQLVLNFGKLPSNASVTPEPLKLRSSRGQGLVTHLTQGHRARENAHNYIRCPALCFQVIWLKFSGKPLHSLAQLVLNFGEPSSSASVSPKPLKLGSCRGQGLVIHLNHGSQRLWKCPSLYWSSHIEISSDQAEMFKEVPPFPIPACIKFWWEA